MVSVMRNQWTNFAIDLAAFVTDIRKSQTFKSIDTITVCANCKLRKIFTLKNVPTIESGLMQDAQQLSNSQIDFPIGVDSKLQILPFNDVKPNENPDYSRMNSSESLSSFNDSLGKSTS